MRGGGDLNPCAEGVARRTSLRSTRLNYLPIGGSVRIRTAIWCSQGIKPIQASPRTRWSRRWGSNPHVSRLQGGRWTGLASTAMIDDDSSI